jgi:hypothetical protein
MANQLYISATGLTNVLYCSVSDSHGSPTATANITAENCGLGVGDYIEITLGYVGNSNKVFSGYVKSIDVKSPEKTYTITASNVLIRAIDYFIASTNPDEPYTADHISAENLVGDMMALAGLTNYTGDASSFTFGINDPVKVNLVSSFDFSKFIADLLAWHVWADIAGKVHFEDRKPYFTSGGSVGSFNSSNLISISYSISDRDLRNRVVVYGSEGVYAEAKQSSPYLPSGFFKTSVVSAPGVITSHSMAQSAANYNLALYNRLTRRCTLSAIGDPGVTARNNVQIDVASLGVSGSWYAYGVEHAWSKDGYVTNVDARK